MEILSPIKNIENAKIAIKNGADALYLASPSFGARVNAAIDYEEIHEIIKYAKSYNVKTYITFNVVIFEDELEEFERQLRKLVSYKIDAIILQDFAFIDIIKENFPDLEIHCSTQMHIHNSNATEVIKSLGANRIVVPREMNFERIKNIKEKTDIDIECFIHGALCVCYSGQCYDSTLLDQKSANRGRCSQYCRMKQQIINRRTNKNVSQGDYPLNLKDLNNLKNINKYQEAKIDSLKIEGRLKNIDYVGHTTKAYFDAKLGEQNNTDLSEVYNRTFTTGRINHQNGHDIVNLNRPNNTGKYIGKITEVKKNTNRKLGYYKYIITLQTDYPLNYKDNIRIIGDNFEYGQILEQFEKIKNTYHIYTKDKVFNNSDVYITKNQSLIDKYKKDISDLTISREKIPTEITITTSHAYVAINNQEYPIAIDIQVANNVAITKDDIIKTLSKTKNTDFDIDIQELNLEDNLFIANRELKKLRDEIIEIYQSKENKDNITTDKLFTSITSENNISEKQFYISCRTKEQLNFFLNNPKDNINILMDFMLAKELIMENDFILNDILNTFKTFLILPRIIYDDENEMVHELLEKFNNICISEIGSLKYIQEYNFDEVISNFTLNTTNSINLHHLEKLHVDKQMLSIELNKDRINQIANDNSIVNIYGRIPVMIMDYCPINLKKTDSCNGCTRCRNNDYYLHDNLNRKFPLVYEGNNRIGMYTDKKLSLFKNLKEIPNINNYFLNLTFEEIEELEEIFNAIENNNSNISNSFNGNFYKETL